MPVVKKTVNTPKKLIRSSENLTIKVPEIHFIAEIGPKAFTGINSLKY